MAGEAKVKVAFTRNALDEETQKNYYRGETDEFHPQTASRLVGAGVAEIVEEEDLKDKSSEELDDVGAAMGKDLSGAKNKQDKIKEITKSQ